MIGQGAGRFVRSVGRATRRVLGWSGWRRPAARFSLHAGAALAILAAAVLIGVYVVPVLSGPGHRAAQSRPTDRQPADGLPGGTAGPTPGPSTSPSASGAAALDAWAGTLSTRLDIPKVALEAYGYAELVTARTNGGCKLTWTTLAGIGKIESNHGRENGAVLLPNGTSQPPIFGPPLDGTNGNKLIRNTAANPYDPTSTFVRALGPMQFLPGTWETWKTDANGDGKADPFDVNDAAMAAARYLCTSGHNLGTGQGWWQAIHSYNNLDKYAADVFAAADDYGRRSRA